MNPLPSEARALLKQARTEQAAADLGAKQRVRQAVGLSLSSENLRGAAGARARLGSLAAKKLATVAVLVGLGGMGVWEMAARERPMQPRSQVAERPSALVEPRGEASPSGLLAPAPAPTRTTPGAARAEAAPALRPKDALPSELKLIARAESALRSGDLSQAASALMLHTRRYPNGQLTAEREGLSLIVRCRRGDGHAHEQATSYLRRAPHGVVSDRVASACGVTR